MLGWVVTNCNDLGSIFTTNFIRILFSSLIIPMFFRSVLTMRFPATPLPESCLSVPREVKKLQTLFVWHRSSVRFVLKHLRPPREVKKSFDFKHHLNDKDHSYNMSRRWCVHRQGTGGLQTSSTWLITMETLLTWWVIAKTLNLLFWFNRFNPT